MPETEVIIRGDVTSEEVVSLLQLLKKRNSGKLILYKEEEQYIMDADEIVYVEVSDNKVYAYRIGRGNRAGILAGILRIRKRPSRRCSPLEV